MNHEVTRQILWNVPLCSFHDEVADAAGSFGFSYYLAGMMEVR